MVVSISLLKHIRAPQADRYPGSVNLLVTDYADPGLAKIHLNAVKTDHWAAIIDLSKETHEKKLQDMLCPDSVYNVYFSIVRSAMSLENQINILYRQNLKRYIDNNTTWRLNRSLILKPAVELTFGELFIILKYAGQTLRIKLSEIEAIS